MLVTGAAGGVGSIAVSILAELGYNVVAGTGREDTHAYLEGLGAKSIVSRTDLEEPAKGPLGRERWAGAIDAVGGGNSCQPARHSEIGWQLRGGRVSGGTSVERQCHAIPASGREPSWH